jgi:hypothetical protein
MSALLAYVAAAVVAVWGAAHAVPTRQVAAGFGPITADNRRVIRPFRRPAGWMSPRAERPAKPGRRAAASANAARQG